MKLIVYYNHNKGADDSIRIYKVTKEASIKSALIAIIQEEAIYPENIRIIDFPNISDLATVVTRKVGTDSMQPKLKINDLYYLEWDKEKGATRVEIE